MQSYRANSVLLLIHRWVENIWIHDFPNHLRKVKLCFIQKSLSLSLYIYIYNIYIYIQWEPLLSNITHSKIMFVYQFVRKLKQCCYGRLSQTFGRVRFVSAFIRARFIFISSTHVFEFRTFFQYLRHFLLNFFGRTLNCSTWETFNNRGSTVCIYICVRVWES